MVWLAAVVLTPGVGEIPVLRKLGVENAPIPSSCARWSRWWSSSVGLASETRADERCGSLKDEAAEGGDSAGDAGERGVGATDAVVVGPAMAPAVARRRWCGETGEMVRGAG